MIVSVDKQPVVKFDDLLSYLVRHTTPGQKAALGVLREGKTVTLEVTLAARPSQN